MEQLLALWTPGVQDGVLSTSIVAIASAIGVGVLKWWSGLSLRGLYRWCVEQILYKVEVPFGLIVLFILTLGAGLLSMVSEGLWADWLLLALAAMCALALILWSAGELLHSPSVVEEIDSASAAIWSPDQGIPIAASSVVNLDECQTTVLSYLGFMRQLNIQMAQPAEVAQAVKINVLFVERALDSLEKLGLATDVYRTGHAYSLSTAGREWLIENDEVV